MPLAFNELQTSQTALKISADSFPSVNYKFKTSEFLHCRLF